MYQIAKENIEKLFELISENQELYLADQLNRPTKHVFFPQSENLYTVKREEGKLKVDHEDLKDQDFVLFGAKACDLNGMKVLDEVFLSDPVDSYYEARRKHGTIVVMACNEPEETCFCTAFDIDPAEPGGDVTIWKTESGGYFWKPLTDKGEALTKVVEAVLKKADADAEKQVEAQQQQIRDIMAKLPYANLSLEGWTPEALDEKFDSELWEELHQACLACGVCTYTCPTCQCYDIKDYNTGSEALRFRCWDSCMYSDFTMMAHGNNRTTQMQRFRQRFMHKLVYFPANHGGKYSCVGCGRCVAKCPSSLNIVKVIQAFKQQGGK